MPDVPSSLLGLPSRLLHPGGIWAVAVALTVACFLAASALMLYDMRCETRERAVTAEVNLLNALSQDIARNVELYDLSLRAVVDGLVEPGFADLSPRMQDLMLYDHSATASDLGPILVSDASGRVMRGSRAGFEGADLSDRDYFRALRDDPGRGLFLSAPSRRRAMGDDDVIALARAVRSPAGDFAGVVVGSLRLDYLRNLFANADLGQHGTLNLSLLDGTRIARQPDVPTSLDDSLVGTPVFERLSSGAAGTFDGDSPIDGARRIYSFVRIGRLPLILDVAFAEDEVLAPWRDKAAVIGAALVTLGAIAGLLMRAKVRSEAEHRLLMENAIDVVIRLDASLRRTFVSASSRSVLGYEPSELLGGSPRDVVLPDDWPIAAAWLDAVRSGDEPREAVFRVRRKDGVTLWVEGRCRTLSSGAGYMSVLRDVSDRRAAEERAAALTAELARLANSDGLTGLANRRRFDAALVEEWERAVGGGRPLSLLLLDVDKFKAFNDRYGHQEGDACLRAVAHAVSGVVDGRDAVVARYGGEEIAVVLPGAGEASAAAQAERVREAVASLGLAHAGNKGGSVTVSVGCATALADRGPSDMDALVALADARLYEAKRLGRDCVVPGRPIAFDPSPPFPEDAGLRVLVAP